MHLLCPLWLLIILTLYNNSTFSVQFRVGSDGWIERIYLSHNNLSGCIPGSFENMTSLYRLDLSFKHLDGKVPLHGVFSNVTGFLFDAIWVSVVVSLNYICLHACQNRWSIAKGNFFTYSKLYYRLLASFYASVWYLFSSH